MAANNETPIETRLAQACPYIDEVTGDRDTPVYTVSIYSM